MKTVIVFFLAFQAGSRVFGCRGPSALFQVYAVAAIAVALQELWVIASRGYSSALLATRIAVLTDVGWGVSVYISAVAVLAAAGSLPAVCFGSGRERVLPVLAVAAGVFTSVVSLARGSLLALAAALVVCALSVSRKMRVPALLLIGAVAAVYLLSPMGQTSLERFTSPQGLRSVGIRLIFYREAAQIALDHPIFGVGPSQMPFHSHFYTGENPHNIFLKNAVDFGGVGLALYSLLLAWVVRRWLHLRRRAAGPAEKARSLGTLVVLSTALVNASVEPTLEGAQYGFLFWFLIGALTAPDVTRKTEESQARPPALDSTGSRGTDLSSSEP
jgi:O-antigen ligase